MIWLLLAPCPPPLLDVPPEEAVAAADEAESLAITAAVAPCPDEGASAGCCVAFMAESLVDVAMDPPAPVVCCCSLSEADARCAGCKLILKVGPLPVALPICMSSFDEGVDAAVFGLEASWPSRRLFESMPLKTTSMQPVFPLLSKTRSNTFSMFLTFFFPKK